MKDSLNIWMANYPKDDTIKPAYQDSCATQTQTTIGVNGGELWGDVFDAIKHDYHVLSGDTRSVSAAGGWLQGVGLSHTCRKFGLGIDNVISFDVVLPSGDQVTADACTNPDLFWALRGGGGGTFGIVTHIEYKLYPKTKVTLIEVWIEASTGASRMFLEYWARKTPSFDYNIGGAWFTPYGAEIFVVGDENEAYEHLFLDDFNNWLDNELKPAGYDGGVDYWQHDSWYDTMGGPEGPLGGPSDHGPDISTRLVPESVVVNETEAIIDLLVSLTVDDIENFGAYWLGGAVNNVGPDETAVHPIMRSSVWAITTTTREGARRLRNFLPNSISGCSFNHHSGSEPNWRTALWGDEHYTRLLGIKNRYDPNRRLNCWHCVGYQGEEYEEF